MSKTADYYISQERECCNCTYWRTARREPGSVIGRSTPGNIPMVCDRTGELAAPDDVCGHFKCATPKAGE